MEKKFTDKCHSNALNDQDTEYYVFIAWNVNTDISSNILLHYTVV